MKKRTYTKRSDRWFKKSESTDKPYTIVDKRGKQISSLYPTPSTAGNSYSYRQRLYVVGDTKKIQTAYDRYDQIQYARSLFGSMPDLGGALISKGNWCVGSGFSPVFTGKDKMWGEEAETWLEDSFYPTCNVLGANFDFRTTLYLSSLAIDIDGDSGLLLTSTRSGYPQIQLIPSHRIGQRNATDNIVKGGKFDGYQIHDGCILNDTGRAIGYRILGDKPEDDVDVSAASLQLLYEPEWCDQSGHGISRIARSTLDWLDTQDISEFQKRSIKLASTIGLIHLTESGEPDAGANIVGATEDATIADTDPTLQIEKIQGGEVYYMKANAGEDIKPMMDERPSPNTMEFLDRIQRKALYAVGWAVELLDPSKLNGGAVRLIQDLARKSIASRQLTLERRAKWIVNFAVAKAMNAGLLPQNNGDWYSWGFTKGSVIQVDLGNEEQAQRESYKLGTATLSEIAAKKGQDWVELREQQQRETEDLLVRATALSTKHGIDLSSALSLLSQRSPNPLPLTTTTQSESK